MQSNWNIPRTKQKNTNQLFHTDYAPQKLLYDTGNPIWHREVSITFPRYQSYLLEWLPNQMVGNGNPYLVLYFSAVWSPREFIAGILAMEYTVPGHTVNDSRKRGVADPRSSRKTVTLPWSSPRALNQISCPRPPAVIEVGVAEEWTG